MIDWSVLVVFVPTFFFVSVTPGMCMTLALTMGMSVGLRRTLWMMWGELAGVGLVSLAAVVGVATVMLNYPALFLWLKYLGGAYLIYLGVQMWGSRGRMAIPDEVDRVRGVPRSNLALQGFVTAIANPKAWAFMVSLLPPFIDLGLPMVPQLTVLLAIILVIEFLSLVIYATGGRSLRHLLQQRGNVRLLNRVAGTLMMGVGVWLALG